PGILAEAGGELLRADRDRAAAHALRNSLVDEHLQVAPHGHLADVELAREIDDSHPTFGVEPLPHQLEPLERLHVHPPTSSGLRSVARASSTDAYAPTATPCMIAVPSAVASTGPTEIGRAVRRPSASR